MRTRSLRHASALALALVLPSLGLSACGGRQTGPTANMARFNAALCPRLPAEDRSRPLDPNLEGVSATIGLVNRTVPAAGSLRLSVTYRNGGQHALSLSLPQRAFTLAGFELVDAGCVRVPYAISPTARALGYGNSGPMPLAPSDSATIDTGLDDLAPGLTLKPGIYALRLALAIDPMQVSLRGKTVYSDWMTFAVSPPR